MTFAKAVQNTNFDTLTTNGMPAFKNTADPLVDFFFMAGASRGHNIIPMFERAFQEDPYYTGRLALWLRDIRGGAGERKLFRDILKHMEANIPHKIMLYGLLPKVPEVGRWDDLLIFDDEEIRAFAFSLIEKALLEDKNGLCAKWMPRKGYKAYRLRAYLGLSAKEYRRLIVDLSNTVEQKMCSKQWGEIQFDKLPSVASARYQTAFFRNAKEAYEAFKAKLVKGTAKVNAAAVYPYDIIKSIRHGDKIVSLAQWESLPNYVGESNILPMVDVSGSMDTPVGGSSRVSCMDVALSLGLYLADKNKGAFKDTFLTFSSDPELVVLKGNLIAKLNSMKSSHWSMSTDLEKAVNVVLEVAIKNKVPQEHMPEYVLILSDMQFDHCTSGVNALTMIKETYNLHGYEVPKIIFWNLNSHDNVPVRFDETGTSLISGFSPSIMKSVLKAKNFNPRSIMDETINNKRYDFR